jgi:hypothetical protein
MYLFGFSAVAIIGIYAYSNLWWIFKKKRVCKNGKKNLKNLKRCGRLARNMLDLETACLLGIILIRKIEERQRLA